MSFLYKFIIMYPTQPRIKWVRDSFKNIFNQETDPQPLPQQIHHFPDSIRKSIKLNKHRIRSTFTHKSKQKDNKSIDEMTKKIDDQLTANINICKFFSQDQEFSPEKYTLNMVPNRPTNEFLSTTDRMLSIRKRLSPMKRTKYENRILSSVDSIREDPVKRLTFLNIQKLQLIKIYSEAERRVECTRGTESFEQRYDIDPNRLLRKNLQSALNQKLMDDKQLKDIVISLKKTMKEGHSMKLTTKPRVRPFLPPFQRYFYKDFIWKVAFSNGLILSNLPQEAKVKVFVGKGNNSQLVRSIIKRRPWWSFTQKCQQANFIWTQLKINSYFNLQQTSQVVQKSRRASLEGILTEQNALNLKIMNQNDLKIWDKYFRESRNIQEKLAEDMAKRNFAFRKLGYDQINFKNLRMQNHVSQNFVIGNKKALLYTMRQYYESKGMNVFENLPLSFHIVKGIQDSEYTHFLSYFYERKKKAKKQGTNNVWIVKPGELTNRGNGIIVCLTLDQIKNILKKGGRHHDGSAKTFILQEYIQKPFLYHKRKFDIRHYMLITSINGHFKGYWFKRGYIRTSSAQYTLQHGQASVHLTNDAVQKLLPDYGRYQKGNKVSYEDFQLYLEKEHSNKYNFFEEIYPKMKKIAADVIKACARTIDPKHLQNNFQLFGMDFMIDGNFKPWLIEVNSNPCLQLSCPLLTSIIPDLIQNTLKICVDSVVGPPIDFTQKRPRFTDNALSSNQFQLVYDSIVDEMLWKGANCLSNKLDFAQLDREEDEQFQDDGVALQD